MKSERWKKIQHRIEYFFLQGFILLTWMVSLKTILLVADCLGWFVFSVLRVRRVVVLDNLARAFPEKSNEERLVIAVRCYKNFCKMMFEYIRFPLLDKETVFSLCSVEGLEHFDWALERGKGAVLVGGHFGNWEFMGAALAQMGYPISFLVGEQHNKFVDDMMNEHRRVMGIRIIHMGIAVRGVIRTLRSNRFVALLSDQDARSEGIFVDFFGRPSSTHQGPAVFALKTGAPIIFGSAIRLPYGRHRLVIDRLCFDHLEGITQENIREVTQAYTSLLERWIRDYPDHWFWMHRRWKTSPMREGETTEG